LMMASVIHSNVRNLGLFFIYDKVGISKWKRTDMSKCQGDNIPSP
jgi:hypothetical protein